MLINYLTVYFRSYHFTPSTKGVYPVHLNELDKKDFQQNNLQATGLYKNHFFDYKDSHMKVRIQKTDVSKDLSLLRCV